MNDEIYRFHGLVALQQRVLPAYRAPFFDALASACDRGLSVLAGQPRPQEQIATTDHLQVAQSVPARNFHFLQPSSPFYQCWQAGLINWLESCQPEALIVEANPRYLSTLAAIRWMHDRGRPVLGWGLGASPLRGLGGAWRGWSRKRFLKSLDGMISYSQRGAGEYRALGLPVDCVYVAPNAVAWKPKAPPPPRASMFEGRPKVLFVGRLQARKRIDNLLRTCAALPESIQPELWIVGDGPARGDFQSLAENLYPQAEFMGAHYGVDLERYFAAADLFVLPGTGGLAVQQAMSFGLPVIVAQGDGTQDDLVRPENGWLVPAGDLAALTLALQAALSDPLRLRRKGEASYRLVFEEVNLENMVKVFVQALSSVEIAGSMHRQADPHSG